MFRWLAVVLGVSLTVGCHAMLPLDTPKQDVGPDTRLQTDVSSRETMSPDGPLAADLGPADLGPADAPTPDAAVLDGSIPDGPAHDSPPPDLLPAPDGQVTGPLTCAGMATYTMPSFSKACVVNADCYLALHQIDCGGTLKAIGINKQQAALFTSEEQKCRGYYPSCKMMQGPTQTEDGSIEFVGATLAASCVTGACQSHVKECGYCQGTNTCFLCSTSTVGPHFECSHTCYADSDCLGTCLANGKPTTFCSKTPLICL